MVLNYFRNSDPFENLYKFQGFHFPYKSIRFSVCLLVCVILSPFPCVYTRTFCLPRCYPWKPLVDFPWPTKPRMVTARSVLGVSDTLVVTATVRSVRRAGVSDVGRSVRVSIVISYQRCAGPRLHKDDGTLTASRFGLLNPVPPHSHTPRTKPCVCSACSVELKRCGPSRQQWACTRSGWVWGRCRRCLVF